MLHAQDFVQGVAKKSCIVCLLRQLTSMLVMLGYVSYNKYMYTEKSTDSIFNTINIFCYTNLALFSHKIEIIPHISILIMPDCCNTIFRVMSDSQSRSLLSAYGLPANYNIKWFDLHQSEFANSQHNCLIILPYYRHTCHQVSKQCTPSYRHAHKAV